MILAVFVLLAVALASLVFGVQSRQDPLVFASIAASGVAGLVLAVAFLRSRPRQVPGSFEDVGAPAAVVDLTAGPPAVGVRRKPAPPLPIADYQDLEVAEILSLLNDLDRDELRAMEAHESETRAHPWILARIQTLLDVPPAAPPADEPSWSARDFPLEQWIAESPDPDEGSSPPGLVVPAAADEWENFPIADYEWLPAVEILPLLGFLEPDELLVVRLRELAEGARPEVVGRIDALLGADDVGAPGDDRLEVLREPAAELPPPVFSELEEELASVPPLAAEEPAAEVPVSEVPVSEVPVSEVPVSEVPVSQPLPIERYDELSIGEVIRGLVNLGTDELQLIREYEKSHRARTTVLVRIDTALARR